jgi:3'(2'), 5'-bisphosphate nucleotidase
MTTLLDTLLEIAGEASKIIAEVYDTNFVVEFKGPKDPVTAADKRANALIVSRLSDAFPGVPIVAEESDPSTFTGYRSAERVFFVDPLDGTAEFVARNGQFVVMIGLVEEKRAVAGVVAAPALHTAWAGALGEGAFEVDAAGARKPATVSTCGQVAEARLVSSRSHRGPLLEHVLSFIGAKEILAVGSAGLKGAHVASGLAELYVAPGRSGQRWDACAVDALLTAAGGRFTDAYGDAFDYRAPSLANDRGIVATNGLLHDGVLAVLAKLLEANR